MADVSLSTLPTAPTTTLALPGVASTVPADGTADGTNPFASLLTYLVDPGAPGADAKTAQADVRGKAAPDTTGAALATLTPDLSAFLPLIAPPQIASIVVRAAAQQGAASPDGATPNAMKALATILTQPAQVASGSIEDATLPAPSGATVPLDPASTGEPAVAPAAPTSAAIGAPAGRTPDATFPVTTVVIAGLPQDATSPPVASAAGTALAASLPAPANEAPTPRFSPASPAEPVTTAASPAPLAAPATIPIQTADPIATDGSTPVPTLATTFAEPAALKPMPRVVALAALRAAPVITAEPERSSAEIDTALADVDDKAVKPPAKSDPAQAVSAPDLSAFLTTLAPPPQAASVVVRTVAPRGGTSPDGAAATVVPRASVMTNIMTPPAPTASLPMQEAPAPAPRDPAAAFAAMPTSEAIAPDRMARALAAMRVLAARTPEPAAASLAATAAAAIVDMPAVATSAAPAAASANAAPAAAPEHAAPAPQASATPVAEQPGALTPTIIAPVGTPVQVDPQNAVAMQDSAVAPRQPVNVVPPGAAAATRGADPAPAAATASSAAAAEPPRAAPVRARKVPDTARVGDVRADVAPARIDVPTLGQAAPPPLADDPVARQLSVAQDGQWLDSLAKDIAGAGNANGQLNFRLDPDHLGSLTVQLTQTADGASIRLTASTEAARAILADAQPRLVAEARAQGLTLRDATVETRTATPAPTASANASFGGSGNQGSRSDQGGVAAQLQQQSQQQGGNRQRAPDQPRHVADPAPRAATSTRSGADLYA